MTAQISDIQTTIQALLENLESALESGNAAKMAEFYTENGMLLPAGSDFVKGKKAIKEYWQTVIDMGIQSLKLNIIEVEKHDDTAIEMSRYTLSSADDHVIDSGKGIVIWKNRDGAWKLHRDIWNSSIVQEV